MEGKVLEIRIDYTKNLGNYQSEKLGLTYAPSDKEDVFEAINLVRGIVTGEITSSKDVKIVNATPEVKNPAVTPPITKPKATPVVKEKVKEVPAKEVPAVTTAKESSEEVLEEVEEEVAVETPATPVVDSKPKRASTKVKETLYDRNREDHKRLIGSFLDASKPNWRSKEVIVKVANASKECHEKEMFIGSDGMVLESFKNKFLLLID